MSERLLIIGAGKVARGLAASFRVAHVSVLGVHARTPRDGATSSGPVVNALGHGLNDANVIIVAVSDIAIDSVCAELVQLLRLHPHQVAQGAVVLNTSGVISPSAYTDLRALGIACGTFHPLVPFPTAERGAAALRDGWIGIDGDATACATSRRLAAALGARTINIPAGNKAAYHTAAVMASNFPIVLAALATRLLSRAGVDERASAQVVEHLMRAAVANLAHGSALEVLTGPAVRGDAETMAMHRGAIATDPDAAAVYDALSRATLSLTADHASLIDNARVGRRSEAKGGAGN